MQGEVFPHLLYAISAEVHFNDIYHFFMWMSCDHTTFSLVLVKMQRERDWDYKQEIVANIYDYFEEVSRRQRTQTPLKPMLTMVRIVLGWRGMMWLLELLWYKKASWEGCTAYYSWSWWWDWLDSQHHSHIQIQKNYWWLPWWHDSWSFWGVVCYQTSPQYLT